MIPVIPVPATPVVDALNHLLRQNPWTAEELRAYAGKTVQINLPPVAINLTLIDSGEFVPSPDHAGIDATIALTPLAALRFLASRQLDHADLELRGDTEFAAAVGKVLQQLEWEFEEDLSRLIGDIPAHGLVGLGKRVVGEGRRQFWSVAGMLAEYWEEEQPLIAKKRHLERFVHEVDRLRDDTERLEKRLEKLEKLI
ncbi:MAG TPA: SCP2 sterol-binding domain-containing protein [Novimethylophilus sp.]|uniref:ubiquinone biosynthesis accessory factor UbiJ n=1 Tax=Novimethylophilus sp. TaxID=2137426 RepID=UPI002F3F10EF